MLDDWKLVLILVGMAQMGGGRVFRYMVMQTAKGLGGENALVSGRIAQFAKRAALPGMGSAASVGLQVSKRCR